MSATVSIADCTPGLLLANATVQGVIDALRPLISVTGTLPSNMLTPTSVVPDAGDRGKIWPRIDVLGTPLGLYAWLGAKWVRVFDVPQGFVSYVDLAVITDYFDLTLGYGLYDSPTAFVANDYYGWKLHLDGEAALLHGRFLVSADRYNPTTLKPEFLWNGTYASNGGSGGALIDANQIPRLPISGREYDSAATPAGGDPYYALVSQKVSGGDIVTDAATSGTANDDPQPLEPLPRYAALGLMTFVGYIYTNPTTGT